MMELPEVFELDSNSDFDSDSEQTALLTEYASDVDDKESNMLNIWEDVFLKGFKNVNVFTYIIFGLEVFAIMILMIVAGYAMSTWADAALIKGVSVAESQNKWSLAKVSRDAWPRVWSLIWINVVPWLLAYFAFLGVVIMGAMISVLVALILKDTVIGVPFGIFAGIVSFAVFMYFLMRMLITSVFAKRYAVIDNIPGDEAWKLGWKTSKGNLSKMIRLSAFNIIIGMFLGIVVFIPFAGVAGVVFLALSSGDVSVESLSSLSPIYMAGLFIPISFVVVMMISVFSIFSVLWKTLMYGVQHYAFLSLRIYPEEKKAMNPEAISKKNKK